MVNGGTTLLFESTPTYPDPSRYWETIEKHRVNQFYCAPTAVRLLLQHGNSHTERHDRSSLKTIGSDNISSNSNNGNGRGNKKQSQRSPRIVIKKKTKKRHRNDDDHGPGTSSDDSKRSKRNRVKKI